MFLIVPMSILLWSLPALGQSAAGRDSRGVPDRLAETIDSDSSLSPETREALERLIDALRTEDAQKGPPDGRDAGEATQRPLARGVGPALAAPMDEDKPPWEEVFERLKLSGDLRLRHESSFELDDTPNRHRQRLRLRLRLRYQLDDELLLGGGIRTGDPGDPNSPYVTFGDGFDDFDVSIDHAFVKYEPEWVSGAWITAGKFVHPFHRNPIYGELVWDADVNPEGVVAGFGLGDVGPFDQIDLMLAGYTVLEDFSTDDVFALAAQASGRLSLREHLSAELAAGYYLYTNVVPDGNLTLLGDNAGNATVDRDGDGSADDFVSDFGIFNTIASLTWEGWRMPLTVAGEYIWNTQARGGHDQGWALGASLGKTKKKGDWRIYYQWQVVEQEAVFSPFAQDDFLLQTNHRSHVFGSNYQLADNVGLQVWGLISSRDLTSAGATTDSDKDQWRLRVDLTIKF